MGVRAEDDVARFGVAFFGHKLMADSVASVYMGESVFVCKCVANLKMTHILHSAGRHQMVVDQDDFIRVP